MWEGGTQKMCTMDRNLMKVLQFCYHRRKGNKERLHENLKR
jgi:hypothetical protein